MLYLIFLEKICWLLELEQREKDTNAWVDSQTFEPCCEMCIYYEPENSIDAFWGTARVPAHCIFHGSVDIERAKECRLYDEGVPF